VGAEEGYQRRMTYPDQRQPPQGSKKKMTRIMLLIILTVLVAMLAGIHIGEYIAEPQVSPQTIVSPSGETPPKSEIQYMLVD